MFECACDAITLHTPPFIHRKNIITIIITLVLSVLTTDHTVATNTLPYLYLSNLTILPLFRFVLTIY